jgi:hypothetical protein
VSGGRRSGGRSRVGRSDRPAIARASHGAIVLLAAVLAQRSPLSGTGHGASGAAPPERTRGGLWPPLATLTG